jgi:hypothetical protein
MVLLCIAAPAGASVSHVFAGTFGAEGSTPADHYPLAGPTDVAVDQTSHDIYVTDPGNYRVEKFDSSGNLLLMIGKEVDQTSHANVCVIASGDTCQAGVPSSAPGGFEAPTYLGVDNSGGPSAGDLYVADTTNGIVSKFASSGNIVSEWQTHGQLPWGGMAGMAVRANGDLYLSNGGQLNAYEQNGTQLPFSPFTYGGPLKVDAEGYIYTGLGAVYKTNPYANGGEGRGIGYITSETTTTGFEIDSIFGDLYQDSGSVIYHYGAVPECEPATAPCNPLDSFGSGDLSGAQGVAVDGTTGTVYVANTTGNNIAVFGDIRPKVTTGPPTDVTETGATLTGHIDPAGHGPITSCRFEYGLETTYGTTLPCSPNPAANPPNSYFEVPTEVTAVVSGFSPGTHGHYRLVVSNAADASKAGADETFITTAAPAIDGLASAHLTATTADLNAQVNPNGLETTYRFEYGTTISYGQSAPVPDGSLAASDADQSITVHLAGLVPHVVYHYRLVATNADGTAATGDQTFNFFPPPCPNENVRQQTESNYLPDCRAYELVSPANAGGTQLFSDGPNTGQATNPSRFSFTGLFSTIPGSGGEPIDGNGDLYVATRTDVGWVTRYVGWPSSQAAVDGGPAMGPPGSSTLPYGDDVSLLPANDTARTQSENGVITDSSMDTFLSFNDGVTLDTGDLTPIGSNAPLVIGADGQIRDRWPTNLDSVPQGSYGTQVMYRRVSYLTSTDQPLQFAPGGSDALDCPAILRSEVEHVTSGDFCPGDVTASADLSHFVFATEWNVFAPGGQLSAPGSVYDNNTATDAVATVSKTPAGDDIPSEPADHAGDPLQIPAVSSDGSHILMASEGTGPCGSSNCGAPPCGDFFNYAIRCPLQASHLYMRVGDVVTYDVSAGHNVTYVGMDGDGTKVYFTSPEQLTSEDHDSSIDLYMWSEAGEKEGRPLTLISKGNNPGNPGEPGQSDLCSAAFVSRCGVALFTTRAYCQLFVSLGGNCISDNFIGSENGDIYFFSPEQLDGSRGLPNRENLYVYRDEHVQYVATFSPGPSCYSNFGSTQCSNTQILRMQVSPDDSHMAFVTSDPLTQYDNAGRTEMYTYEPSARKLVCVSCIPSGAPPTSEVYASQDGLFMANDGRTFWSTEDSLVPADTNHSEDVYEYVDGRPQLITPGTGESKATELGFYSSAPGLTGVSADGRDVYFSTYDTLVSQDHNGLFLKFYDARADGGFPATAPPPPCAAADECHGPDYPPAAALPEGTRAELGGGGNLGGGPRGDRHFRHEKRHKRSRSHRSRHRRAIKPGRGGPR